MSGHNKWSQIKHRKGAQDAKKSAAFSKILAAISIAARPDPKPESNPRLRSLIEKARAASVPKDTIERAVSRASEDKDLVEFTFEAYGPGGVAILVSAITDSSNRLNQELRVILGEHGGKVADPGSVLWAFEKPGGEWRAKFPQDIDEMAKNSLTDLTAELEAHPDVQTVVTNAK